MISVEQVTKVHHTPAGEHCVLDRVSLTIRRGQSIGILGQNGAGKSTLTRLISGCELPTSGRVRREMSVSWALGFGAGFQSSLTGSDNARFVARIYGVPVQRTLDFVKEFSELGDYFYMPFKTYSSGMRGRLAFAISLAVDFDCYLVDEITAAGDHRFTQRCRDALAERRRRGSLIMVSHQPNLLKQFCDSGAVLHGGHLTEYEDLDEAIAAYRAL